MGSGVTGAMDLSFLSFLLLFVGLVASLLVGLGLRMGGGI